jgi:Protein of unknown function (DUF3892)
VSLRITCIEKKDRFSPHERIRKIGGVNKDGTRWWLTQEEAIAGIESGRYSFHVDAGGASVKVVVAEHNHRRYLKTEADGQSPDNLLSLPDCE